MNKLRILLVTAMLPATLLAPLALPAAETSAAVAKPNIRESGANGT